jgi:Flp pilus assembly protein TadD
MKFEDTGAGFDEVAALLAAHPHAGILVDVRDVQYTPSPSDVRHFVNRHTQITRMSKSPLAVVAPSGVNYGMTRMLCALVEVSGGRAHAFTDLEEAREWLREALRGMPSNA